MTEARPGLDGAGQASAAFRRPAWPATPPLGIRLTDGTAVARRT